MLYRDRAATILAFTGAVDFKQAPDSTPALAAYASVIEPSGGEAVDDAKMPLRDHAAGAGFDIVYAMPGAVVYASTAPICRFTGKATCSVTSANHSNSQCVYGIAETQRVRVVHGGF